MSAPREFGRIRAFLFPVHRHEYRKVLPMMLIFFFICFNYNVLRAAKDALIVTAPQSGAEAIPFIKVWAIIPAVFLMTYIYTRISNRFTRERVFYVVTTIFLLYFFFFAFVLYPFRDALHPHALADQLQQMLPAGFRGLIAIIRNWTYTSFYIMSELWSTMMMTVLCWGFANEVTSVKDAKRHYGLYAISAHFSGIAAGQVAALLSGKIIIPFFGYGGDPWGQSIMFLCSIIIVCGFICMGLLRWLHVQGMGYNAVLNEHQTEEPKIKMGMRENFAYLAKSRYLIAVAVIVIMYNMTNNLIEVVWKDQVKALYPNPSDFNAYMGKVLTVIGVLSTFTSIFVTGNLIRKTSWTTNALVAPVIIAVTGIGFFSFMLFQNTSLASLAMIMGSTPLAIGVFFGSAQNCMTRALKYTLFDATKELAFIPLSQECRLKGKAAIDGIGSRVGKSGGSIIHQGLLLCFGSVASSTPYVAAILFGTVSAWIIAVQALGRRFNQLISTNETIEINEAKPLENPALNSP
jgi:ATP:ADP antiporter, AAA family